MPIDDSGMAPRDNKSQADPEDLITKNLDLQLHAALLLLQARVGATNPVAGPAIATDERQAGSGTAAQ